MSEALETPTQRSEAAKPFLTELARLAPKPLTLFGIEQHVLDLLDFRQDVIERLAETRTFITAGHPDSETLSVFVADMESELMACNMELSRFAGAEVEKVDHIANLLRMCDRMEAHSKEEKERHARKAKRWAAIKEGVEQIVMEALTLADKTRFDSPTNTLRMQRNGSPRVEIVDPQSVQDRFVKITLEVTVDRWKQMREAQPDLVQYFVEKERTFATGAISKTIKAATAADVALETLAEQENWPSKQLSEAKKQVDRVRGAKLVYGKHLRCE